MVGGPVTYRGRELGVAHADLSITPEDFMRVAAHLSAVLEGAGLESGLISAVLDALALHQGEIVTARTGEPSRGNARPALRR
jgi:hemoglobin